MAVVYKFRAFEMRADTRGFSVLSDLYSSLVDVKESSIELDMSNIGWFDGHLSPAYMTTINLLRKNGNKVFISNISPGVKIISQKNRFLSEVANDTYHTTISVKNFPQSDAIGFSFYVREGLRRPEMPKMTPALLGKFFEGIDEVFQNSCLHSKSEVGICAGGQFYPRNNRLSFTISDGGIGISGALQQANIPFSSDDEAINWAMTPGNTTRRGDIPGGLGLKIIRDFVRLNNGALTILSAKGYWRQAGGEVSCRPMRTPFPGTVVVLEINTNDRNKYDLAKTQDPRDIW